MIVAIVAALGSALLYAVSSVVQQRLASAAPAEQSMRVGLLVGLARRPLWWASMGVDVGGFGLQALALATGALVVVQPLLVSGLLFALPLGAVLSRTTLRRREWAGAAVLTAGLALFLIVADPAEGRPDAPGRVWLPVIAISALVVAAAVVAARGPQGARRAGLLGVASGVTFGVTAALTKTSAWLLGRGLGELLTSWQLYALVAAGFLGLLLSQSAFQAGPLSVSLSVLTVVDPVVSILLGAVVLQEHVRTRGPALPLEVVGLVAMTAGVLLLARSPVVLSTYGRQG